MTVTKLTQKIMSSWEILKLEDSKPGRVNIFPYHPILYIWIFYEYKQNVWTSACG